MNRSAFTEVLEKHIKNERTLIPVFILDINRFRIINESQGHDQGDFLLKQIASRVLSLSEKNQIARLFADKFIVYSKKCHSYEEIEDLAEKYQQAFKNHLISMGRKFFYRCIWALLFFQKMAKMQKL